MSKATLLHRESSSKSVKAIVEAAHRHRSLSRDYQLSIRGGHLLLEALKKPPAPLQKQPATDEGFESDIDSISLISTDDPFTPPPKNQETDSANGSAFGSDSDSDSPEKKTAGQEQEEPDQETFSLVNCICYTDIKFPDTLVFVILNETLVFQFGDLGELQLFYSNFSTVKAIANQRAYGGRNSNKFNLLQRTDANGVTHIEISRPQQLTEFEDDYEPTSIISISAPESFRPVVKSVSSENLLDRTEGEVKKFWGSVENLLDAPQKQERRKRQKGPAPPPPVNQNVLRGQFVRVNVQKSDQKPLPPPHETKFSFLRPTTAKLTTFQQFKSTDAKPKSTNWTNSIPRLLKKNKTENRVFLPLAYRYIDTTIQPPTLPAVYIPRYKPNPHRSNPTSSQTISNRLFGMSSKLKEFNSVQSSCNLNSKYQHKDPKYSSLTNLHCPDGTLKSVIKKDDVKKKNDKKVTFSAYNTVQVV